MKKVAFVTQASAAKVPASHDNGISLLALRSGALILLVGGGLTRLSLAKQRNTRSRA